jgi:hypothetical protein
LWYAQAMKKLRFDAAANLPAGVHRVSLADFRARFGAGSPRREWLVAGLDELLAVCKTIGKVKRVILWGSFVTATPSPNDLDVFLVPDATFEDADLMGPGSDLFDHERPRLRFHADVFWVRETIGQSAIDLIVDTYQVARDKRRRGIVELNL